jgi:hypothetical protein
VRVPLDFTSASINKPTMATEAESIWQIVGGLRKKMQCVRICEWVHIIISCALISTARNARSLQRRGRAAGRACASVGGPCGGSAGCGVEGAALAERDSGTLAPQGQPRATSKEITHHGRTNNFQFIFSPRDGSNFEFFSSWILGDKYNCGILSFFKNLRHWNYVKIVLWFGKKFKILKVWI